MTAFLPNIPFTTVTRRRVLSPVFSTLLQTGAHSRMEYLKFADLQRRTSGIRYNNILTCLRLLCQCCAHVNILDRKVDNGAFAFPYRSCPKSPGRMAETGISFSSPTFVAGKTCQIDRGLCVSPKSVSRSESNVTVMTPFSPLQDIGFYFRFADRRQMHQHGFVWDDRTGSLPICITGFSPACTSGKIKTVLVNTYLSDEGMDGFW